jgi:hypothetical protein
MKEFIIGILSLIVLAGFGALTCAAQSSAVAQQNRLHGVWIGGHPATEGYVMVRMRVGLDSAAGRLFNTSEYVCKLCPSQTAGKV